uniref:Uncharacterized protein n=1 Tax=Quercus lobata TaxID=97700 RepID=A0A7N2R241_QUELO
MVSSNELYYSLIKPPEQLSIILPLSNGGRLHCLYPWWADATVDFMISGGYNVSTQIQQVGRLHCLYPWWEDATVDFMISGGYNVSAQVQQVKQKTLIISGEDDQIISNKLAVRLRCELPNATIRQIPDCGHLPRVERPN